MTDPGKILPWQDRIIQLAEASGGRVTPDQVVADAMDPESPLHSKFTWDDSVAARQYRVEQARVLIGRVRIQLQVVDIGRCSVKPQVVQAFVRDLSIDQRNQGYIRTDMLRDEEARSTLAWELSRAEAGLRRVERIAQALGLGADIGNLQAGLAKMLELVETVSET